MYFSFIKHRNKKLGRLRFLSTHSLKNKGASEDFESQHDNVQIPQMYDFYRIYLC